MKTWHGALLLITIALAWATTARGDVTGNVTLQIGLFPLAKQTEAVAFNIDFEVLSDLRWTVSGLTLGNKAALGVTGIEHSIFSVETTLGAIGIHSVAVFATPFVADIPDDIDGDGILNALDPDIDGDGVANLSDPAPFGSFDAFIKSDIDGDGVANAVDPDIDGDGILNALDPTPFGTNFVVTPLIRPIGPVLFVKKRFQTTVSLGGFTLQNLAILEDVGFTHPFSSEVQSYSASMQDFRFGNIITIMGQTVSGINLRSVTGLGADPGLPNLIKKAHFKGSVCQNEGVPDFAKRAFAFCVEQLYIDNVSIGSLTLNSRTEFRILPLVLSESLTLDHGFFNDAVDVSITFEMDDLITISPMSTRLNLSTAPLMLSLNLDSGFKPTSATATVSASVDQSLFQSTVVYLPDTGVNSVSFDFKTISLSGLSVFANVVLTDPGNGPGGGFGNQTTTFKVHGNITPAFGVRSSMSFTNAGINAVHSQLSFKF